MSEASFYWHDYETWGANPQVDRPAQFAGLRTNLDFEPVQRPLTIYSQPTPDFLPHPEAVLITGITPQHALAQGMNETSFAGKILEQMSQPNTTIVGYNSVSFDDEVTRHLFYRNFIDPYAHTWQHNNSRWDLIDVVRACYALRPEGVVWPENEAGQVSMRLEHLTKANGIEHGQAHDAMADVHATIAIAKLLKQSQPKLFEYAYSIRRKQTLKPLVDLVKFTPLAHVAGFYGANNGYLSLIMPLGYKDDNPNALVYWNLREDPRELTDLSDDQLQERRFAKRDQREALGWGVFGAQQLQLNRCPFLAPRSVITAEVQQRWQFPLEEMLARAEWLQQQPELRERLVNSTGFTAKDELPGDPETQLYSGAFFSDQDRSAMAIIRASEPEQLAALDVKFSDPRLPEMLFRYRARNFPNTLSDAELQRWRQFCQQRLLEPLPKGLSAEQFMLELEQSASLNADNTGKQRLLKDLYNYVQSI
ncbi:exodeoxyribonuclease I [Pseudidiomarina sp. 1APP75-27a]|uniref:exodeoxyribonuclease I n=1 Tax=Pseudidiomarina terrestris TaxID=2820060 RepID=UPI002B058BA1|nr:exodeoxyribonuclease I [Pseudidiomarina sp. 1APP75-27a]MEA3586947.1 exodeoxyribonuclease I [Pseudidiomarina sp. 1APP75-27a]